MKEHFDVRVLAAQQISSNGDLRLHVVSSVRLLLQQAVYGLLEWASKQPTQEGAFLPSDLIGNLINASDGTLIDVLEALSIYCEQVGWQGISRCLFSPINEGAACRPICGSGDLSTASLLRGLVKIRNDGAEGHGLPGDYDNDAETDCLREVVANLAPLLPQTTSTGDLALGPEGTRVKLKFLRLVDGGPSLIRSVKQIGRNKLRVEVQYLDKRGKRQTSRFETDNFFSSLNAASSPKYQTWSNSWGTLCYLPERTTESFQGRYEEQLSLINWMADEDSRTCLVYGDGGVGKTTLVIEFLHRYLDEDPEIDIGWKPKVVSFFTAKKWRWGIDGVELICAGQPHLLGLIAHLHLLLLGRPPSADFYRLEVGAAAIKLQHLMSEEAHLKRDDHLIVIDNSETLVSTDQDVEKLGRELRDVSRRVGRVIITSRRREVLEATPVLVDKLKPLDAVALLKQRARALGLKSINRANDTDILSVVNDLGARPIVLEAFLKALTDPVSSTLTLAKERVAVLLRRDLGEFLFADAWARYSPKQKRLLLLMTSVADVHDARQLAICCRIADVTIQDAEEAFEESSGIASMVRLSSGIEVSFSSNFLEFAKDKKITIDGKSYPTEGEIDLARRQYSQFVQAIHSFQGDRIAIAFRTPLAKAAHKARKDGNNDEALRMYQQAVLSDPNNGWLFDRFAYFLLHDLRDSEAALVQAKRATELLPKEGEVWFTRGLVESRQGDFRRCEVSLERAESLGVDRVRCFTQRAWAYLKASPALLNLARKEINFLRHALASVPTSDRRWTETGILVSRLDYLERRGKNVRGASS